MFGIFCIILDRCFFQFIFIVIGFRLSYLYKIYTSLLYESPLIDINDKAQSSCLFPAFLEPIIIVITILNALNVLVVETFMVVPIELD